MGDIQLVMLDLLEQNLIEYFPETNMFIEDGLKGGGGVLVHW